MGVGGGGGVDCRGKVCRCLDLSNDLSNDGLFAQ